MNVRIRTIFEETGFVFKLRRLVSFLSNYIKRLI